MLSVQDKGGGSHSPGLSVRKQQGGGVGVGCGVCIWGGGSYCLSHIPCVYNE